LKILLLNTDDFTGGAAIACRRLLKALRTHTNLQAQMLVQESKSGQEGVIQLNNTWFSKKKAFLRFVAERLYFLFLEKSEEVRFLFNPAKFGIDISDNQYVTDSDVIHLNWINFGFLSIESIKKLAKTNKPIVWTLHDMWAFTGGCHHSRDCENYQKTCGNCVQFLKNPSPTDLSHQIWREKMAVFSKANLTIITCSEWLGNRAKKSSLFQNISIESIPNPIDIEVFRPIDKKIARKKFNLDENKKYILFAAMRVDAVGKGFAYFSEAISIISNQLLNFGKANADIEIIIFGQAQASDFETLPFKVNILGRLSDLATIAHAYSAASVFVIPSLEDNLPNTIMESMACGTPVVGFDVGGIPEMIDHEKCGYLAQYKSAEDLANGIYWTLFEADYQKLIIHSRQKVLDNYAEHVVAEKYKKVYETVAPRSVGRPAPDGRAFYTKLSEKIMDSEAPPSGAERPTLRGASLSIITITYNAEPFLERTIQSILAQTDQNFEYIIIDGRSTDGTLQIARKYKNRVNKLISEPDKGLYDAMNKGLKNASGDFVWFMNAGDEINDNQAVEKIYQAISDKTDVLYGDTFFVDDTGNVQGLRSEITPHRLPKELKWQDMKLGMLVCHQAFVARKSIAPFYMENNLSADVDWEIACLKLAREVKCLDFVVAKYLTGGISNKQLKRSLLDRYEVLKIHFGFMGAVSAHFQILFRGLGMVVKNRGKYW